MRNIYILVLGLNMGMDLFKDLLYIYSDMCESVYTHTQRCVEIYFQHILNIYTACCIKKRMILYVHKIAHCSWDDQAVAREGATA